MARPGVLMLGGGGEGKGDGDASRTLCTLVKGRSGDEYSIFGPGSMLVPVPVLVLGYGQGSHPLP